MSEIQFFRGPIRNTKPLMATSLKQVIDRIKNDEYREAVEAIRAADAKVTAKIMKERLDYVLFSGTFKKRANDALIKHSGLICIDFDGVPAELLNDVKSKLPDVDFVAAYFVSPSGEGMKVVCRINGAKHAASFEGLKAFFKDNFDIPADKGVKDVARACFMSWDPDAYHNPKAKVYNPPTPPPSEKSEIPEIPEIPVRNMHSGTSDGEESESDAKSRYKLNEDFKRARFVADQIAQTRTDITNNYDDWQVIAFSLAVFGDRAYDMFHTVSAQNPEYDVLRTDEKWKNAMSTRNRIKHPTRFFSIAKDYGLNTRLPRTIDEAQQHADAKTIIGDDAATSDFLKYGIYFESTTQTYFSLNLKGKKEEITNFKMRIIYHVATSDDVAFRIIQIKNTFGLDKVVRVNTDDFVSAGSFKKVIARQGNFIFKGADHDLIRLQDMLQREEKPTELVDTLGWHPRGGFYAFANGIYLVDAEKFLSVDEFGIVEHERDARPQNYFIPAMSRMFAEKEDMYTNDKKFRLIESEITFEEWAKLFDKVFGENGRMGIVFYVAALFRDIIFAKNASRFPMLFAYGKRGSGKGTMIQSLMRLFGEGQDQIMLGGKSTIVGFMRKLAQYRNALVWLDEYKNTINLQIIESIKNIFDGIGYERGRKDNTFQTESTPIRSAAILSGQEMPTVEPALFTRVIQLVFTETKRSENARKLYRQLTDMESKGISHLTVYLMRHRKLMATQYKDIFERTLRDLSTEINNADVDERMLANMSAMIAVCEILADVEKLPFTLEAFRGLCKRLLLEQFHVLRGSDDTSKFWQIVEQLVASGFVQENRHFQLLDGYIDLRVQDIYQLYVEAMHKRRDPNVLDKSTLDSYLMSDTKTFVKRHRVSFGCTYKWAMRFRYAELGIDLIIADSVEGLKARYRAMNMDDKELDAAENRPAPVPTATTDNQTSMDIPYPGYDAEAGF